MNKLSHFSTESTTYKNAPFLTRKSTTPKEIRVIRRIRGDLVWRFSIHQ
jgi:hypothetical protein